jgi:hypothetical protein
MNRLLIRYELSICPAGALDSEIGVAIAGMLSYCKTVSRHILSRGSHIDWLWSFFAPTCDGSYMPCPCVTGPDPFYQRLLQRNVMCKSS